MNIDFEIRKQQDKSKIIVLLIIFALISFLVLFTFAGRYDFSYNIVYIRTWQYLLAFFSGGALGIAGLLLQKMTKNSLSDISILGIGSLNIICIILYIFFAFDGTKDNLVNVKKYLPLISIAASIFGTCLVFYLSQKNKKNVDQFIITGISLQFLFEAINLVILNVVSDENASTNHQISTEIANYSYGRFSDISTLSTNVGWRVTTIISFVFIVIICFAVQLFHKQIDLMEINEEMAQSNGINVKRMKKFFYLCIALLAGIESSLIGTISLLGIIAPNISKIIFGNRSQINIFASFFIGGILVLFATFLSVNLSQNIPIGILSTSLIVPVFIYFLIKKK